MTQRKRRITGSVKSAAATIVAAAVATVGCGRDTEGGLGEQGALGNGTFSYRCVGAGDMNCTYETSFPVESPAYFDSGFAVGSSFQVGYQPNSGGTAGLSLASTTCATVTDQGGGYSQIDVKKAGYVTLLAGDGSVVQDLYNLSFRDPDRIVVETKGGHSPVTIEILDTVTIEIEGSPPDELYAYPAYGKDFDFYLAGHLPVQWTTSDTNVLAFTTATDDNRVGIATHPGTATAAVTYGSLSAQLTLTFSQ